MLSFQSNQLLQANCPCEIQCTLYTAIPRSALVSVCTQHSGSNMDPSLHSWLSTLIREKARKGRGGGKRREKTAVFSLLSPLPSSPSSLFHSFSNLRRTPAMQATWTQARTTCGVPTLISISTVSYSSTAKNTSWMLSLWSEASWSYNDATSEEIVHYTDGPRSGSQVQPGLLLVIIIIIIIII